MGRVFVLKAFGRWARKEDVTDEMLLDAIDRAEQGIVYVDHGDDVVKLQIAREGRGKSKGYRTVVAFRRGDRAFFLDGWGKNEQDSIKPSYLKELKSLAQIYLDFNDAGLVTAIEGGAIREIEWTDEEQSLG